MTTKNTYLNPVCDGADPFILLYEGKYYLYATNATDGFLVYESENLVDWENRGYCLKKGDAVGEKWFWAPEVMLYNNKFYMIYTVDMHVAVAVSQTPLGPFEQKDKKWLMEKEAIDGHFFLDDDGTVYLYYRWVCKNKICGVKMNEDMMSVDEESTQLLITPGEFAWEVVKKDEIGTEGPFVLKHKGKYYLTYSANDFQNIDYAVGYAVSDTPLGAYKKYEGNPILHRTDKVYGTGHHSFTTSKDGKRLICVYHCHNSLTKVNPRMTCIDLAEFVPAKDGGDDILVINGPTSTEQASII